MSGGCVSRDPAHRGATRAAAAIGAAAIALALVALAANELFFIFAGVLFAVLLDVASEAAARRLGAPRWLTLVLIVVVLIGAAAGGGILLGARLTEQLQLLAQKLPHALSSLRAWVKRDRLLAVLLPELPPSVPSTGAGPHVGQIEPGSVLSGATSVASGVLGALGAIVIVFFIGVYGAAQPKAYSGGLARLFAPERRPRVARVLRRIEHSLARWLYGRLVAMAFVGVFTTIGLVVLRLPLAFALGVIAGVATFVEYLGAVASAVPPVLLALTQSRTLALWVIALFTVTHVVEGYILTPLVTKTTVRFPPAFTLAVQVIFWALFGVLGVTFATSVCVVIAILIDELYVRDVLGGEPPAAPSGEGPTEA